MMDISDKIPVPRFSHKKDTVLIGNADYVFFSSQPLAPATGGTGGNGGGDSSQTPPSAYYTEEAILSDHNRHEVDEDGLVTIRMKGLFGKKVGVHTNPSSDCQMYVSDFLVSDFYKY